MTVDRDEFFHAVKAGDRFAIYDRHGKPEPQLYTATGPAIAAEGDLRVPFEFPPEQTRAASFLRWSRCDNGETFEIVDS